MDPSKISIVSFAFVHLIRQGMMDVFGYLEACRYRYHLDTADIWNGSLASPDEEYIRKVRRALDERGLRLVNVCCDGTSLWDADGDKRQAQRERAQKWLRAAEILGARTVRIDVGGSEAEMSEEMFDHVVGRYRELARRAGDNGYRIGPENHHAPTRVPRNLKKLREAVGQPAFGILLHVGRWDEDADTADTACAAMAFHTHVTSRMPADCEATIAALRQAGYDGCWGIESASETACYEEVGWHVASVRRALRRLESAGAS